MSATPYLVLIRTARLICPGSSKIAPLIKGRDVLSLQPPIMGDLCLNANAPNRQILLPINVPILVVITRACTTVTVREPAVTRIGTQHREPVGPVCLASSPSPPWSPWSSSCTSTERGD